MKLQDFLTAEDMTRYSDANTLDQIALLHVVDRSYRYMRSHLDGSWATLDIVAQILLAEAMAFLREHSDTYFPLEAMR